MSQLDTFSALVANIYDTSWTSSTIQCIHDRANLRLTNSDIFWLAGTAPFSAELEPVIKLAKSEVEYYENTLPLFKSVNSDEQRAEDQILIDGTYTVGPFEHPYPYDFTGVTPDQIKAGTVIAEEIIRILDNKRRSSDKYQVYRSITASPETSQITTAAYLVANPIWLRQQRKRKVKDSIEAIHHEFAEYMEHWFIDKLFDLPNLDALKDELLTGPVVREYQPDHCIPVSELEYCKTDLHALVYEPLSTLIATNDDKCTEAVNINIGLAMMFPDTDRPHFQVSCCVKAAPISDSGSYDPVIMIEISRN